MRLLGAFLILTGALAAQTLPWVDLSGPWKIQESDDPRFAAPKFDDSAWKNVTLPRSFDYTGSNPHRYFWLRKTFHLPDEFADQALTLTLGKLSENYELYLNGQRIAVVGQFDREHSQLARPRSFDLPRGTAGRVTLALRLWLHPYLGAAAWRRGRDPGPYVVTGAANAPRWAGRAFLSDLQHQSISNAFLGVALLTLMSILALIYLSRRTRLELLWLALFCGGVAWRRLAVVLLLEPAATPWTTAWGQGALNNALLGEFFLAAYGVRSWALRLAAWTLALAVFTPWGYGARNPWMTRLSYYVAGLVLFYGLLRTARRDAASWLIALAGVLLLFVFPSDSLGYTTIAWWFGSTNPQAVMATIFALVMVLVLTRKLLTDQTEKQRLAGELEAARTVQSLLLEQRPVPSGLYAIDAAYWPAAEVGGDFYWHRAEPDGALVVVAGDVSGKGLKAAMLVSVAVGILRNEKSGSPAAILAALNAGLAGHTGGGFVTCCVVRLEPDGRLIAANAGHPAPYLNGQELDLSPGLPLGVVPGTEYTEAAFSFEGPLTLVSDGVVEAANAPGELFGFDRTRAISMQSAQAIADAAKQWGQNDDITVVTVRRDA